MTQAQKIASSDDIVLAIAHFNTPCALATVSIFHEAGISVIVPAAIGSKVTAGGYKEVVRTCNTDLGQAKHMAMYLRDVLGAERIYSVDDSTAFGKGLANALENELSFRGIELTGKDSFHVGDVDFSAILGRIEASSPDAVVLACMAAEGAPFRKQMVQRGRAMPLVGFSGLFYETFIEAAGRDAEGTQAIFPLPPLEDLPGGSEYTHAYQEAGFQDRHESAGPFCYVAGQVAVQVLEHGYRRRSEIVEALRTGRSGSSM